MASVINSYMMMGCTILNSAVVIKVFHSHCSFILDHTNLYPGSLPPSVTYAFHKIS